LCIVQQEGKMFVLLPHSQAVVCCRKSRFLHQLYCLPQPVEGCASLNFDCQSSGGHIHHHVRQSVKLSL